VQSVAHAYGIAKRNGNCYCDCHGYRYGNTNSNGNRHVNCDGYGYGYGDCHSNGYCVAKAYSNTETSSDTASPTVRLLSRVISN
jgi:hypothetical protein